MTPADVLVRLTHIESIRGDDERAHIEQDELYEAALQSIADGSCDDPVELARIAILARHVEFSRWYA